MSKQPRTGSSSVIARSAASVSLPKNRQRAEDYYARGRYDITWLQFAQQVNEAHTQFFSRRGISSDKLKHWA